ARSGSMVTISVSGGSSSSAVTASLVSGSVSAGFVFRLRDPPPRRRLVPEGFFASLTMIGAISRRPPDFSLPWGAARLAPERLRGLKPGEHGRSLDAAAGARFLHPGPCARALRRRWDGGSPSSRTWHGGCDPRGTGVHRRERMSFLGFIIAF